jgi:putative SOS response-associated peptidase YedK
VCGRFNQTASGEEIAEAFALDAAQDLAPRYNIAPTQPVPVVVVEPASSRRMLVERKWGLVPRDALGKERGFINARAESAASKPAFSEAFAERRCLVPATGFYEWQQLDTRRRQPWLIRLASGAPFAFAGLWEPPAAALPGALPTFTILTTQPNDVTRKVHDRMPVILAPASYARWLDPALRDFEGLREIIAPFSAQAMTAYPVSTHVNNAAFDDPACLAPA